MRHGPVSPQAAPRGPMLPRAPPMFPCPGYPPRVAAPTPYNVNPYAAPTPVPMPLPPWGHGVPPVPESFIEPPTFPQIESMTQEEDDALLGELAKKVKTLDPDDAAVIDPLEVCSDPTAGVYAIRTEPNIFIAPNFLSDEECTHLLELSEATWAPTLVMTAGANGSIDNLKQKASTLRTSQGAIVDYAQTPMVANIEKRLSAMAGVDVNHLERLVMVKYDEGQEYKIHHDGTWRLVTVFIYLNELPEDAEGETFFPNLDIKIKPRKGCAVMWANVCGVDADGTHYEDSRVMHAGLPPKDCTKYGVNCFFNVAPKRILGEDEYHGQGPPTRHQPGPPERHENFGRPPPPFSPCAHSMRATMDPLRPGFETHRTPRPMPPHMSPFAQSMRAPLPMDMLRRGSLPDRHRLPAPPAMVLRHAQSCAQIPMGRPPPPRLASPFPLRSGRCVAPAFDMRAPFQVTA